MKLVSFTRTWCYFLDLYKTFGHV